MPDVTVNLSDAGLASSTLGAIGSSAGAGAVPLYDPALAWDTVNGRLLIQGRDTVAPDGFVGIWAGIAGPPDNPTNDQFFMTYAGTPFTNVPIGGGAPTTVIDDVATEGWKQIPGVLPGYTHNMERYWHTQYTTEDHTDFTSIDGTVAWRPWYYIIKNDTYQLTRIDRGYDYYWFSRPGTTPLVRFFLSDSNAGKVTIQNDGTSEPLEVITTGNNFFFTANPDSGIIARTGLMADATNTTRDGVLFQSQGASWNGSASVPANTSFQTVVTGNNLYHAVLKSGLAGFHFFNDGKLGVNIASSALARVTENIVMPPGYLGVVSVNGAATYRAIGVVGASGSERVTIDPDQRGTTLSGVIGGITGATPRGPLDVANTVYVGTRGAAHGVINSDDGLYFNADANNDASDGTIGFGRNRAGAGIGGTNYLILGADGASAQFFGKLGFNGTTPIAKPTITGSAAGNAAVQSIAAVLASLGLVTNSTT